MVERAAEGSPVTSYSAVPFVDLRAMHEEVRAEIETGWRDLIDRSAFVGGAAVTEFERDFAAYDGVPHCVGVGSGTDALRIALQAVGVEPGDAVVTVPHTFIATVEGITQAGAFPIFVDVDPASYTMDVEQVDRYLARECTARNGVLTDKRSGRHVSCLLPVHLYGQSADLDPLVELAQRYGLKLVEDAAQAHGARYRGRPAGSLGDAGAFSFYPGKNLGAMGEAGAITTRDRATAERCRLLRDHGQRERYLHVTAQGGNGRLDALQAVVLRAKLRRLEVWTEARREVARRYDEHLSELDVVAPREMSYGRHVYHLYVVQVPSRDRVRTSLERAGIATGLHYPVPLHLQEAYAGLGLPRGTFPVSEQVAARGLSLPMFPHLTAEAQERVVLGLRAALDGEAIGARAD
jgi:dTDP-4-amino-4,6-dideoxygalactose transaminase